MTKRFAGMLGLTLCISLTNVKAADLPQVPDAGVNFTVANLTLGAALNQLNAQSGIEFSVTPEVEGDLLTADLHDSNWSNLVHRFLSGYNYVGHFDAKSKHTKIVISSRGKEKSTAAVAATVASSD